MLEAALRCGPRRFVYVSSAAVYSKSAAADGPISASRTAASTQAADAIAKSPGNFTGRMAPAIAMIPVPMTDANQFGPSTIRPSIGDDSAPAQRFILLEGCCSAGSGES